MKLTEFLTTCTFALCFALPLTACDGGDDDEETSSDTNAENADDTTGGDGDTGMETDCSTYCVTYIEMCLQTGMSMEFETDALCNEACGAWDQAGIDCRYDQIVAGMCGEAGNMGSSCT